MPISKIQATATQTVSHIHTVTTDVILGQCQCVVYKKTVSKCSFTKFNKISCQHKTSEHHSM